MYIKSFHIQNFKSFEDVKIDFNPDLNVFTGANNSGKTTMLEAIALWQECFTKLLRQAQVGRRGTKATSYRKKDYVLGNTQERYFHFEQIYSVRNPNYEDIFFQREKNKNIVLSAILESEGESLLIPFQIKSSGLNYDITLVNFAKYDWQKFNQFFRNFPSTDSLFPIHISYASPVAAIQQTENFATPPNIREAMLKRQSMNVLRNRLYAVYHYTKDANRYKNFLETLNYILFNGNEKIEFFEKTNIQTDTSVVYYFKIGNRDTEKDIALLGSGTLQIIEILLNFFYKDRESDLNLVLLDEPDSHIHRDIQKRLIAVLQQFSNEQIFLTTHNEALIRSASPKYLFHFEGKNKIHYQALPYQTLPVLSKTGDKRFAGIYELHTNHIIKSLGGANGLDFINAIEADKIFFVEGEDDAQAIYFLLNKATQPNKQYTKKYVFWVINGISHVFNDILSYKTVFEKIRNEKTLWEKSVLIMDRDFLSDEHYPKLAQKMQEKLGLTTYISSPYTFEGTILTDLSILAQLLEKWLGTKQINISTDLYQDLVTTYQNSKNELENLYLENDSWKKDTTQRYRNVGKKTETLFGKNLLTQNDIDLTLYYQNHLKKCLDKKEFYKVMKKENVEKVIQTVLKPYSLDFEVENDFLDLLKLAEPLSLWFDEWDFLKEIVK